jgi:predicted metal-dependent enzyme (double-stranded beta helix superfamily)
VGAGGAWSIGVSEPLRATLESWVARDDLAPLATHRQGERTYALLHRDDDVEIYLIGWMPGHDTGFHDHDHSAAAIAVLEGEIAEERLALSGTVERRVGQGEIVTIAREAIHRVRHAGTRPATTLHAYSPPLQRVGTYEVAGDGALLRHPRPAETPLEAAA